MYKISNRIPEGDYLPDFLAFCEMQKVSFEFSPDEKFDVSLHNHAHLLYSRLVEIRKRLKSFSRKDDDDLIEDLLDLVSIVDDIQE